MKRTCAVLALGVGLLATGFSRAGEGDMPAAPAATLGAPVGPVVPLAPVPAGHGGGCGGCCGARGSCWDQLCAFFCYRALPVPPCCRCLGGCCRAYACHPPVYTYFMSEWCHEGRWYGNGPQCDCAGHGRCGGRGCGRCGGGGYDGPVGMSGPVPVGAVVPAPPPGTPVGSPTPPVTTPTNPLGSPVGPPVGPRPELLPTPAPVRP